jgi:hypothetical protein
VVEPVALVDNRPHARISHHSHPLGGSSRRRS